MCAPDDLLVAINNLRGYRCAEPSPFLAHVDQVYEDARALARRLENAERTLHEIAREAQKAGSLTRVDISTLKAMALSEGEGEVTFNELLRRVSEHGLLERLYKLERYGFIDLSNHDGVASLTGAGREAVAALHGQRAPMVPRDAAAIERVAEALYPFVPPWNASEEDTRKAAMSLAVACLRAAGGS